MLKAVPLLTCQQKAVFLKVVVALPVMMLGPGLLMAIAAASQNSLSVIIPALNEAEYIHSTLAPLQSMRARGVEVILVDGGSDDETVSRARPFTDQVIRSARGRARQMQAGVALSSGCVLWFLHADTRVPDNADQLIFEALENRSSGWGRFDVTFSGGHALLGVVAWLMNRRSCLTGIATGDQAIFIRRGLFDRIGGFQSIPLMEDIALSRALKQSCRPVCINQKIESSPRRWHKHGVIRTILSMWGLRFAYYLGVSSEQLAKYYVVNRE
jgi:rSAM/selenodomain-associated transferase 2